MSLEITICLTEDDFCENTDCIQYSIQPISPDQVKQLQSASREDLVKEYRNEDFVKYDIEKEFNLPCFQHPLIQVTPPSPHSPHNGLPQIVENSEMELLIDYYDQNIQTVRENAENESRIRSIDAELKPGIYLINIIEGRGYFPFTIPNAVDIDLGHIEMKKMICQAEGDDIRELLMISAILFEETSHTSNMAEMEMYNEHFEILEITSDLQRKRIHGWKKESCNLFP